MVLRGRGREHADRRGHRVDRSMVWPIFERRPLAAPAPKSTGARRAAVLYSESRKILFKFGRTPWRCAAEFALRVASGFDCRPTMWTF
ncbi:hypothetical protein EVAR_47530_1 [Eumeta japonica]|uniref:Uncharacterized protein n=1 Tax=Eumeta variegata TaxID=151549 RepID=A0A4C1XS88_EUMVA|nr:hypothetical protein EVAR_47530_1 [Eumeta japonica]